MVSNLVILKGILNSISDEDLNEMEIWINNEDDVELIAVDNNAISLITDKNRLKIDEKEW